MASWIAYEQQTVHISPRVTAFTVVCEACARDSAAVGFAAAAVHAVLPLERTHGSFTCGRGHQIRAQRMS